MFSMKTPFIPIFRRIFSRTARPSESGKGGTPFLRFGHPFQNPALLEQALTHRSYLHKQSHTLKSNERLEFLGDSVLGLIVTDALYRKLPDESEGSLTRMKSHIVSRERLTEEARRLGLGEHLILGASEDQSGGRKRNSILSDAYEAMLGAIFLDGGLEAAKRFVEKGLLKDIGRSRDYRQQQNYKSWLLEHVQAGGGRSPLYRVAGEAGPDHVKEFTVEVVVRSTVLGVGKGLSKKKAEQAAAKKALEKLELL
jgi:ribonuclease III